MTKLSVLPLFSLPSGSAWEMCLHSTLHVQSFYLINMKFATMRINLDLMIKPLPASNALSREGEKANLLQWGAMWRSSDALLLNVHAAATR